MSDHNDHRSIQLDAFILSNTLQLTVSLVKLVQPRHIYSFPRTQLAVSVLHAWSSCGRRFRFQGPDCACTPQASEPLHSRVVKTKSFITCMLWPNEGICAMKGDLPHQCQARVFARIDN